MNSQCGAELPNGKACTLPSGHGTAHPGVGRCSEHELTHPLFPFKYRSNMVLNKKGYGMCRHESELSVFQDFEKKHDKVSGFVIEPIEIPYSNSFNQRDTTYTPDLLVKYKNGKNILLEIKSVKARYMGNDYSTGYKHPINFDKYQAGINYAKEHGCDFKLCVCELISDMEPTIVFISSDDLLNKVSDWEIEQGIGISSDRLMKLKNKFTVSISDSNKSRNASTSMNQNLSDKNDWRVWSALSEWANETLCINTYWQKMASDISALLKNNSNLSDKQKKDMETCWKRATGKGFKP